MAELDEKKVKFEIDGHPLDGYIPSPPDDRDYTLETVCALDDEELPEEYITDKEAPVVHLMVPKEEEEAPAAPAADAAAQPESSSTKGKKDEEGNLAKK